ncbi:HD-GYP domain-containing protein (c-di-GMP phosphodiesterase class II) [Bradyrhizobium sp. USDA 4501]
MLGNGAAVPAANEAVVVNVDLRVVENIETLKGMLAIMLRAPKRVFVVDQPTRLATVQAYALGATHVLVSPIKPKQLLEKLSTRNALPGDPTKVLLGGEKIASEGADCLSAMFRAAAGGLTIDVAETRRAGNAIADYVTEHGLAKWLTVVRRYHEGTYQHCLLVTGIAVGFGLDLGMVRQDIDRLHAAAIFHDIGKATIPLAVLGKPGKLDDRELPDRNPSRGWVRDALGNRRGLAGNPRCGTASP